MYSQKTLSCTSFVEVYHQTELYFISCFRLVRYLVSYAKETSIYILVMILMVLTTCSPVHSLHGLSNGSHNKIFTNIEELGKEFCC